jgi:hypothetical protein
MTDDKEEKNEENGKEGKGWKKPLGSEDVAFGGGLHFSDGMNAAATILPLQSTRKTIGSKQQWVPPRVAQNAIHAPTLSLSFFLFLSLSLSSFSFSFSLSLPPSLSLSLSPPSLCLSLSVFSVVLSLVGAPGPCMRPQRFFPPPSRRLEAVFTCERVLRPFSASLYSAQYNGIRKEKRRWNSNVFFTEIYNSCSVDCGAICGKWKNANATQLNSIDLKQLHLGGSANLIKIREKAPTTPASWHWLIKWAVTVLYSLGGIVFRDCR